MTHWLETIGREFVGVHTDADVYQATVTTAHHLLDADVYSVAVADDDVLRPEATVPSGRDCAPSGFPIATSIPGAVYTRDDPCVIEDLADIRSAATTHQSASASQTSVSTPEYRSLVAVPIGEVGVLIATSRDPAAFTEADRDRAEDIATFAAAALERIRSTQSTYPNRLDEIASILSHDLQTPLQVARGRLELAEATGDDDHLSQVAGALDRIEALADDLVMLARTDERIGAMEPVDLEDVVNTAWSTAGTPAATLELEESVEILADKSTAFQLLENLFSNAINHAGPDVTVRVGMLETGFYVEDDGPGIPADQREQVFEWGISSDDGHTGLGLAIVERIAQAHSWDLTLTDSESGGARFEITDVDLKA